MIPFQGGWFALMRGGSPAASHEAVRLSGAVGEGPLRTPSSISCFAFVSVGDAYMYSTKRPQRQTGEGNPKVTFCERVP